MVIEDGKFYFIKDEFFDVFKDYGLMVNKENGNKRPVYNFVFGNVLGKKAVFLIQNIFPTTVRDNVIITSLRVVELAERGINIPFYDIVKMKNLLLNKQ